ncbi:TetR/AcrR family transcriptional regulator [Deinococcus sp. UR1]|uniref:TetR/AcrR family transcriptional regulator n=1 Tax=Deinococcus sp. UR1 TaxID=1704277 RepID=UPI0006DBFB68|nr:TetR/AcrR family transcriptional regulator [Deinococcus sp. UR1]PIG97334.1 TetR/AcrR family transcriptional regulator [Deinococcus sp. UR1]
MRRTRTDWLTAGLTLLRDEGEHTLTIERLCRAVGLSKGSFYHHFQHVEAYRAALLSCWEETQTDAPIQQSEGAADPLHALRAAIGPLDHPLELAVRAWAVRDGQVRAALNRVDARRTEHLRQVHVRLGHAHAGELAELEYATFLGLQTLGWTDRADLARLHARALAGLASAD